MATLRASITVESPDVMSSPLRLTSGIQARIDSGHLIRAKVNATAQGDTAVTVYKADDKTDTAYVFVRNLATGEDKTLTIYFGSTDILKVGGGQFAFIPVDASQSVKAYSSEAGTMIEYAAFGVDSTTAQLA